MTRLSTTSIHAAPRSSLFSRAHSRACGTGVLLLGAVLATGCGPQSPADDSTVKTEAVQQDAQKAPSQEGTSPLTQAAVTPLGTSGFSINLNIAANAVSSTLSGSDKHIITDPEAVTFFSFNGFPFGNNNTVYLPFGIQTYSGGSPKDWFLKGPTPWNDLYTTYGWPQVQTTVQPISAQVISSTSDPVALVTRFFDNSTSSSVSTFSTSLTSTVTNTTTSTWSNQTTITESNSVTVGLKIADFTLGGSYAETSSHQWGESWSRSNAVAIGTTDTISIAVPAHEVRRVSLMAMRGTMKVRITYQATLSGCTAVNYDPSYNGHHFYCYDINAILNSVSRPTIKWVTQDLEIGYYSNATLTVYDGLGAQLSASPASLR